MTPKTQDAPEQTGQHNGNGKPFVLGTLNAEELQEYVTDWIEGGLDWGADAAGALKHHCEMLVAQGPDAGFGAAHLGCVQSCLIEVTLSGDSTDKLFGPLAAEVIFPHVDWQRACSDALKRGPARLAAYRGEPDARAAAKAQGEVESTDEIADSAVSETPPSRGVPTLYAIRRKSDGEFHANDINDEPKIMQVHCFASFDEAAAARLLFSKPEDEIVPLVEAMRPNLPQTIAVASPIARRPKEVHPTTLYGLRLCDGSHCWFAGNESETLDGGPNVKYTPVFDSLDDARKYLGDAKMTEAAPGGDHNDRAYTIMPLAVVQANGETQERSEIFDANEPELAPLPSEDTLVESAAIVSAVEDELSWLDEADVRDAIEGVRVRPPLRGLLKLIDSFDGDFRIRKSRQGHESGEPAGRIILEDGGGYSVLPAKSADLILRTMIEGQLLRFDAAGVLHVADKGRALIGTK